MRIFAIILACVSMTAFAGEHAGQAAEHGGKAAKSAKSAKSAEHGGKAVTVKKISLDGAQPAPAEADEHGGDAAGHRDDGSHDDDSSDDGSRDHESHEHGGKPAAKGHKKGHKEHHGDEHGGDKAKDRKHKGDEHGGKPAGDEHGGISVESHIQVASTDLSNVQIELAQSDPAQSDATQTAPEPFYSEDIKQATTAWIRSREDANGVFKIHDDKTGETVELRFVKIHDPVRQIDGNTYFACTDFHVVGNEKQLYDLDFWLNPETDELAVYDEKIHKEPRKSLIYGWYKQPRYTFVDDRVVSLYND